MAIITIEVEMLYTERKIDFVNRLPLLTSLVFFFRGSMELFIKIGVVNVDVHNN